MRSEELLCWLESIKSVSKHADIIVVPGGGEFADSVRDLQKLHSFDDKTAHKMALLAMNQYGYLLAGMCTELCIIEDMKTLNSQLGKPLPLLWLPTALIEDDSEIPASWDYTSDSIALWLASKLVAQKLVLVKSISLSSSKSSVINHINNHNLDKGFQELITNYPGEIYFMEKDQYSLLTS